MRDDAAVGEQSTQPLLQVQQVATVLDDLAHETRFGVRQIGLARQQEEHRDSAQLITFLIRFHTFQGEIYGDFGELDAIAAALNLGHGGEHVLPYLLLDGTPTERIDALRNDGVGKIRSGRPIA